MSYCVAYFNDGTEEPRFGVFPNVFPTYDEAVDCVIFQIKDHYGEVIDSIAPISQVGGQHLFQFEETAYVIGKMFNFKREDQHA